MIEKELTETLNKNAIKYIDCLGKPFDPNLHQAIGEKESEKEPGIILEEMQKGYLMHDRLLRPSMVYVSKKLQK
jgi:molecular chaperone GrpE